MSDCQNTDCQKRISDLETMVQDLKKKTEQLESNLRRSKRQASPFGKDVNQKSPQKGKPGRKKGKGNFSCREAPEESEIDQTLEAPLSGCPCCGGDLTDIKQHKHIQTDIPLVKPTHIRFVTESGWCKGCHQRVRSRHPQQVSTATGAAKVGLGPNAKALAADMKHHLGIPYAKVSRFFSTAWNLTVTPSGLCQSNQRLAKTAAGVYEELITLLMQTSGIHVDETGWRIGTLSAWLWVFTNAELTIYTIEEKRGHQVVLKFLGEEYQGVLHSDGLLTYDAKALSGWLKQKCLAHLLKGLSELEQSKTKGAVRFARDVMDVLRRAMSLHQQKEQMEPAVFIYHQHRIEKQLDKLIAPKRQFRDKDNARFAKRLRRQRPHLLTFLNAANVSTTNNQAERALRPAVIVRKTGGCNKTTNGAKTHAILSSILQTARQQGKDVLSYMGSVLLEEKPPSLVSTHSNHLPVKTEPTKEELVDHFCNWFVNSLNQSAFALDSS